MRALGSQSVYPNIPYHTDALACTGLNTVRSPQKHDRRVLFKTTDRNEKSKIQ